MAQQFLHILDVLRHLCAVASLGTADGQSHAGALRLGGKECTEDLLRLFWLKSHARIADRDQELTIVVMANSGINS